MIYIPFSGNKRFSYKYVKPIIEQGGYDTVMEPFGGSGVLSVNLFTQKIVKRAVINDYDYFFNQYSEYLAYKDWIVNECLAYGIKPRHKANKAFKDGGYFYWTDSEKNKHPINAKLEEHEIKFLQSLVKQVPKYLWPYLATNSNFTFGAISSRGGGGKD